MIRDKNIFECIFKNNHIWLPHYVVWGPPSHGYQRRKHIFKLKFPELEASTCKKNIWQNLINNHYDKRKVFKYNDIEKVLSEVNYQNFFTNSEGYVVEKGQKFKIKNVLHEIEKLEIKKFAGLIATYNVEELSKKTNVGFMKWNSANNYWETINESKD
mgnify:CR=1 FL=1